MSHNKFRTPNQKNYKRATIGVFTSSTPVDNVPIPKKSYSISISDIDTASSSSLDGIKDIPHLRLGAKKTTRRKEEALQNKKELSKNKEALQNKKNLPKNKEALQNKKNLPKNKKALRNKKDLSKNKKRNRFDDIRRETSPEWETESEESINEILTHSKDSSSEKSDNTSIKLFEDPCSPEKIRDAPIVHESPLTQSPIFNGFRRFRSIAKRTNIARPDYEKLLEVNIPSSDIIRRNPEETDKDEMILHRTEAVKTYRAHRPAHSAEYNLDILWNYDYPTEYYTATSDLLWKKFVEENREGISQYLASPSAQKPAEKYESEFLKKYPDIPPKFENVSIPPGMKRIRRQIRKSSKKLLTYVELSESESRENDVRQTKAKKGKKNKYKRNERNPKKRLLTLESVHDKTDIYNLLNETKDIEFETGGQNGKQMTYSEFRRKQKKMI